MTSKIATWGMTLVLPKNKTVHPRVDLHKYLVAQSKPPLFRHLAPTETLPKPISRSAIVSMPTTDRTTVKTNQIEVNERSWTSWGTGRECARSATRRLVRRAVGGGGCVPAVVLLAECGLEGAWAPRSWAIAALVPARIRWRSSASGRPVDTVSARADPGLRYAQSLIGHRRYRAVARQYCSPTGDG